MTIDGVKVSDGAFAVHKHVTPGQPARKISRLIMNMIPCNSYLRQCLGDCRSMTNCGQWIHIVLADNEVLCWSCDDLNSAFYVARVPSQWRKWMCFSRQVPSEFVGQPPGEMLTVCSNVIPMGWLASVGIFQHLHRRLALLPNPLGAGLPSAE